MGAQAIVQIRVYQTPYNTMMMKIFALLAFVGAATALPSTADDIVPEGFDASGMAPPANFLEVSAFDEAKATVESMIQAGKDEGACADLAAATVKEVEDSVDAAQKTLNSLNTGSDCPNKGQGAVDAAQSALNQANKDKEAADAAASAAASASVNFGSMPLSSLTEGQCGVFFNSAAYTSAVATKESTANAATQAAASVTAAEAGLKAAQEAQQDAIKECQCDAKKSYEAAWEAANANNDANEKAYTKGKHMACVLAGTPPDSCQVGAIPKVTEVTLADGVESATCEGPAPAPAPQGDWTNAAQCNKDSQGCCKGWPNHDNRFSHTNRKDSQEKNMADCMAKGIKEGGHTMIAFAGDVNGDGKTHRCDWWPSAPVGAFQEAVSKGTCCHYWTICPINQ